MYEWIASVDPHTGAYIPMLAEDWTISDTSLTLRFREGVQFHDGWGEFTAADFAEAINNALHEESTARSFYGRVFDRLEVHTDYEATLHLRQVYSTLFRNLSQFLPGFEMMSSANRLESGYPKLDETPLAGTGPYRFADRSEGSFIRFTRVPYQHWRVTPDFPEMEIRFISEESTRLAALLAEEVHISPLATDLHSEAQSRGLALVQGTIPAKRTFVQYLCCFLSDPQQPETGYVHPDSPLMDIRVRRALSKAIDRDALNRALFNGSASTMYVQGYNSTSQGWNSDWVEQYPEVFGYDPAATRALLAEAGYGPDNPYEVGMVLLSAYRGLPEGQDVALAIVDMLTDVGIKVNVESMGSNAANDRMRGLDFDNHLNLSQTSADLFTNVFVYANQVNRTPNGYIIPRLNELSALVRSTTDPEAHSRHFREIGDLMVEHNQNIPLLWIPNVLIYNPAVVSEWVFPGSLIAQFTHWGYVRAAN
jgi:peptide/nickel transport system substrate-binding protein